MPKPENITPHKWQPGQSGNPNGYSRGRRTTDALLRLIDEKNADRAIAQVWLKSILEGDFRFFKEYLERTEGKVADVGEVTQDVVVRRRDRSADGGPVRTPREPDAAPE